MADTKGVVARARSQRPSGGSDIPTKQLDRYPEIPCYVEEYAKAPRLKFEWPNGARVAVLIHTAFEAWSELPDSDITHFRSAQSEFEPLPAGAMTSYDFNPAIMHEYGGRTGVYRVLELYRKFGIRGTFAISGLAVERYPEAVKAIAEAGHEIAAHAWAQDIRHSLLSPELQREEIRRCVRVIEQLVGKRPVGWISPGGGTTDHTLGLLADEGFEWTGDPKNDDDPYPMKVNGRTIMVIGSRGGRTGINDIELMRGGTARELYDRFVDEFDYIWEESLTRPRMIFAVMHTEVQTPSATRMYDEMIRYARRFPNVWFTTRGEVARYLLDHYVH